MAISPAKPRNGCPSGIAELTVPTAATNPKHQNATDISRGVVIGISTKNKHPAICSRLECYRHPDQSSNESRRDYSRANRKLATEAKYADAGEGEDERWIPERAELESPYLAEAAASSVDFLDYDGLRVSRNSY